MLKSMTGFACGEYQDEEIDFQIEIKTLNHRYRDYFFKIPKGLNVIEDKLKNAISQKIARGRIECSIKYHQAALKKKRLILDRQLARNYLEILNELKQMDSKISGEIDLSLLCQYPDLIKMEDEPVDTESIWRKIKEKLNKVLEDLDKSRLIEGENLLDDVLLRNGRIRVWIKAISEKAPENLNSYRENLKKTIASYLSTNEVDEKRLLTEVAIMADKLTIDEELTRLESHCLRFEEVLKETVPVGRKLDFLIQEMNREINTIGSKANNLEISNLVVDVKSEIEKIREQIQNIE